MPSVTPLSLSESRALLGLSKWPVSEEELTAAYRKAAKAYHPDRGGDVNSMKRVNEAFEVCKRNLGGVGVPHPDPFPNNGWWSSSAGGFGGFGGAWDDIWRAAEELQRQQQERQRQEAQARAERARQRAEERVGVPEPHTYVPPKNPQEAFNRARVKDREGFVVLEHWQESKSKPGNITRLFTNLGGLRCTIYWRDGVYRWSAYLGEQQPTAFSTKAFGSRKEAVEDLANVLFSEVDS